ncbi:MAG TPA: type IV toxin-antitoxin system AbiEi family antitoxin domain-containing protein [Acidimicrobiia bacterium]|nr:type IV toxin-antitoxin system AbiEi family antitoxin domain-containing protein [Acidimicrobiia bacterium]
MRMDRRDLRRRLFSAASEQAGYFTAAQAKSLGYSYQAQAHHVAAGNWVRVDRGLFRLTDWIPGVHDDLVRWSLWSKGRAVVSHESALSVHGIGEFEAPRVHLTVPPGFSMKDDAVVLHRDTLRDVDTEDRSGFRVTTPLRSIIDVATLGVDEDQLSRAIGDGRERGLFTLRALRTSAEMIDPRGALYIERAIHRAEAT